MKNLLCVLVILLFAGQSVQAHGGHKHPQRSEFASFMNRKYEIVIDGEHRGHFLLRKQKKNGSFKAEATFHFENDLSQKVRAKLDSDNVLKFEFDKEDKHYLVAVDMNNFDASSNAGVRVSFENQDGVVNFISEDILVNLINEDGSKSGGDGNHDHD